MVGVGGHALQAEEDQRLEGADIGIVMPEPVHIVVGGFGSQKRGFMMHSVDLPANGFFMKADVGQRGKQSFDHHALGRSGNRGRFRGAGKPDQCADERILQIGDSRAFAAYTGFAYAAAASGGLLALIAKHGLIHRFVPPDRGCSVLIA